VKSGAPGRLAAAFYFALFPLVGIIVAYIGFCDPDTCWHLALGRWMFEHHQLPLIDPFSSNIHDFVRTAAGRPIMQHEWLSDLIFFALYKFGGPIVLLNVAALSSTLALLVLPANRLVKAGLPRLTAVVLAGCAILASLFRLWVRPEIFSFLFFAILLALVALLDRECKAGAEKQLSILAAIFILMAVWANCHALFILGLAYLFLNVILRLLTFALSKFVPASIDDRQSPWSVLLAALLGLLGSLCTPWTIDLFGYLAKILTSDAAYDNKENGTLFASSLTHLTVAPLIVAFAAVALIFASSLQRQRLKVGDLILPFGLYSAALTMVVLFRRFTPFGLLILIEALISWSRYVKEPAGSAPPFFAPIFVSAQYCLARLKMPGAKAALLGLSMTAIFVTLTAAILVKPEIPSRSRFFIPACQAIEFIDHRHFEGRLLNDSRLGSMLTFCLSAPPDIFIDGRFDSYSRPLIADYERMRGAKGNYLELLAAYKIGWIFFPPQTSLVQALRRNADWTEIYSDPAAAILIHRQKDNSSQAAPPEQLR
jgi:hypothetical protein